MKRVLVDLTFIKNGDISIGVSVVSINILKGLALIQRQCEYILLIDQSSEEYFRKNYPSYKHIIIVETESFKIWRSISTIFKTDAIPKIVKEYKIDVLFCPFIHSKSIVVQSVPMIGTLHDTQKYHINKGIKGIIYRIIMNRLLKNFKHIITISNSEKSIICNDLPFIAADKISVIHNGIDISIKEESLKVSDSPYILNVNTLFEYKNIKTLILAFSQLKDTIPHDLVIKAKPTEYWNEVIVPLIKELELEERIVLVNKRLTDGQMKSLYKNADLFVTPSTMEGFGLTPVEAAICGVPVISSKIESLMESTMGIVRYYDPPCDHSALTAVIYEALLEKPKMYEVSRIFSAEYSIQNMASKYDNLLNNGNEYDE